MPWYPQVHKNRTAKPIERVQTGIRIKKRVLKVLKGLADQIDITLAGLRESIELPCFEGKRVISQQTLLKTEQLKAVYELDPTASDSHGMRETAVPQSS